MTSLLPSSRAVPTSAPQALTDTQINVHIHDLIAEYTLTHHFENNEHQPIEAVFTFPIPLDAAFLGLQADIAGERLQAQVVADTQAVRRYDDAIADGDSAVLMRQPEPGVLTVYLGQLLPGERAEVELRFANELRAAGGHARFSLPTVLRPRFGEWDMESLETPEHDVAVEHPMSAHVEVTGMLVDVPVHCVTHSVRFEHREGILHLTMEQQMLDRDLVVLFDLPVDLSPVAQQVTDGDDSLVLLSLPLPAKTSCRPLDLWLLLDGSGSMAGAAIEQSREAVRAVASRLGDDDRIQVLRFGSNQVPLFRRPMKATAAVRSALMELSESVDADLGGTEMGEALVHAIDGLLAAKRDDVETVIILVTDGAVQAHDLAVARQRAATEGVRIFAVAVGSSASVEVLEPMVETYAGSMERAVPGEPVDACVVRHLARARCGPLEIVELAWPPGTQEITPLAPAWPGDVARWIARLPNSVAHDAMQGSVRGAPLPTIISITHADASAQPSLRAIIGQHRLRLADAAGNDIAPVALHYGLLSRATSAILVKLRKDGEKSEELPQIRQVMSMVSADMLAFSMSPPSRSASVASCSFDYLDMPAFLRRQSDTGDGAVYSVSKRARNLVPPDPLKAREALFAIAALLRQRLAVEPHRILPLRDVIAALDESMRPIARAVLGSLPGIELTSVASSEQLYVVLVEVLALDLDEGEEIAYARLLVIAPLSDAQPLVEALSEIMGDVQ